ncbi:LysR substrate-binding domain-containing protein [Paucidesulfovibrio longus]|uniref:LysR substrate-binding domain-containing protein n=1 Tax=Paucidesulfovibrio longus TaxID=889 RepID=UPI00041A114A|nr:LysR substrate-binding domain-containing protein [Paucidesulfovibrio longus]
MANDKTGLQLPLDHLRTFVVAAETGGFTSAGRIVHRTQAAVSMQIKRLESELGQELFHREGRGVRPTQAGELLLGYARRLLGLHDEALAALVKPDVAGTVRLGAPEDFAGAPLAQALARFARAHPRVLVELHCEATPRLLESLAAGRLDLTLATGTDGAARTESGGRAIHRAPLAWAVGRGFDTHLTRPLPLAVFHQGCPYRRAAESALDAAGIPWRAAFSTPSLSGALAAVRAGLGVAPVPRSLAAPDCRLLKEDEELPALVDVDVTLHCCRGGAGSPAAALLADLLAEAFADLG